MQSPLSPHNQNKDKFVQLRECDGPDLTVAGVGIDVMDIGRMRTRLARQPELRDTLFSSVEIAHSNQGFDPAARYAGQFALKEAFLKALGTGWQGGIGFREIITNTNAAGQVTISLSGRAAEVTSSLRIVAAQSSVSRTVNLALASVILLAEKHERNSR